MGFIKGPDRRRYCGWQTIEAREKAMGHRFLITYWKARGFKHREIANALGVTVARVSQLWSEDPNRERFIATLNVKVVIDRGDLFPCNVPFSQMPLSRGLLKRVQDATCISFARDLSDIPLKTLLAVPGVNAKSILALISVYGRYGLRLHPTVHAWQERINGEGTFRPVYKTERWKRLAVADA